MSASDLGRVLERRRAVALARHYREFEGLSIKHIADRLGRSPATVKAYFYDPTGEKARAVKAHYVGVCRGCGAYTQPRNGKGDAYTHCKACHPGAIERRWTQERVVEAMLKWRTRYGRLPSSYDWSRTHARQRGGEALNRLTCGEWPAASAVGNLFGTWAAARAAAASGEDVGPAQSGGREPVEPIGHTGDLCAQSPGIDRKIRRSGENIKLPQFSRFPALSTAASAGPRVIRVGEVPGSNPGAPISEKPC
jgi:AraC-like DNA-binding protein